MRIAFLSLLLLAGCASAPSDVAYTRASGPANAQMYCLSKGYERGTFDYDTCYNNRPETQARERNGRLGTLAILRENKSPRSGKTRSLPVE
ncbi:MAG: hypothetical protein KGQ41_03170 [Alphaproteobacteria bacterium]|nr:hypothetical protein [Alphaproteobacteria bacterium]